MQDWGRLFCSHQNSGVYMAGQGTESDIRDAAKAAGLEFAEMDLRGVSGKKGFLKKAAAVLGFPAYFGMNWDAFNDCLTDMAWRPAKGHVILITNHRAFDLKAPADAQAARRIFDSSAQYWKQKEVSFYIIVCENKP